ncbi:hypothetical protein G7072_18450 [Nocardioides sp. HDW12B]|uniref:hypothetical protein n=1 Tax=Nocardioides sp. HDW12B TaxID=2714939 RepID=UPI00140A3582|nr:hypothetical protein [Nocardioides sp. HDW12B]QIK68062.1 hypothetical protein G7072_18450 [Nocardioides sp. HDW12B]
MRSFVLLLLAALVALVLAPGALVAPWVSSNVTDTDAYLGTVEPLAEDPDVQRLVAGQVVAAVEGRLPAGTGAEAVGPVVRRVADQVVAGPTFAEVWRESNRGVHRDVVAVLEGRKAAEVDDLGRVRLDLTPLTEAVTRSLSDRGVPGADEVGPVPVSVPVAEVEQLETARAAYDEVDRLGWLLPVAWLGAVLLGIAVAARRWYAVAVMGVATALGAGLVLLGVVFGRQLFAGATEREELAGAVWDVVTEGLQTQAWIATGVALVVAAAAGAAQRFADRRD